MKMSQGAANRERILTGRSGPPPARRTLRCGDVVLELDGADLRRISSRGIELAQQVFVAVRDASWNTLPGVLEDVETVEGPGSSFKVTLRSRYAYPLLGFDLAWQGSIVGTEDGVISYIVEARALSPLEYNRIGLNILHGARTYAGQRYLSSWGETTIEDRLPLIIGPQAQIEGRLRGLSKPFDRLVLSPVEGVIVTFEFEGDDFEIEDQRNFGDSTFKTYSTPLQRPAPFTMELGQTLRQSVTIRLDDRRSRSDVAALDPEPTIRLGGPTGQRMPSFGLGQADDGVRLSESERERIRPLRPDHIRVELIASEGLELAMRRVETASAEARGLECELLVDLTIGTLQRGLLTELVELACNANPHPTHLFLAVTDVEPPDSGSSGEMLRQSRDVAARISPGTCVGVGAFMFFADLNRAPFDGQAVEALTFPLAPTVHRADDATVMENADLIGDEVVASRQYLGDRHLSVGPITLSARHGPYPGGPAAPGGLPLRVDSRQISLLAAAWTAGCLAELAYAGADALTFFETAGWLGVTERDAGTPRPDLFLSRPAVVFPMWHVLADAAEWRGAELVSTAPSSGATLTGRVTTLVVRDRVGIHLLVASLLRQPQALTFDGLVGRQARVRHLNEEAGLVAMHDPTTFRASGSEVALAGGHLTVELLPYQVTRIDIPAASA